MTSEERLANLGNPYHGLVPGKYMELAYEFGKGSHISMPDSWTTNSVAGKENGETGFITVQAPPTVVSQVGKKQVGDVTSGEKGHLVTVLCTINAGGSAVPPFHVFPWIKVNPAFLNGALPGEEAAATKYAITTTKDNVILILTLPPHTSHRLQPLDRTVYGRMKQCYNNAWDDWLESHPGRGIITYRIAELLLLHQIELESQHQSVPRFAEECGGPLVQSGDRLQKPDVVAVLGAHPQVQKVLCLASKERYDLITFSHLLLTPT
ncbi:unnamed protein product [Lepeophtheirus salmonis]|uniref:(salmon louse) hypothetical protein n=1 Tax=Lepeophtheirus salmonis TaxID=72036 RepID=A0A7R8CWQ8_LEPSM|nr:unnamed protein product [Lepeophtheirus salmonis]CAF2955280.1 unnamed protein product [Lepeophtheirus salmonis]